MGTIGDVAGRRQRRRLPRLTGRQAHQRRQPDRRRRLHEARRLLTRGRSTPMTHPASASTSSSSPAACATTSTSPGCELLELLAEHERVPGARARPTTRTRRGSSRTPRHARILVSYTCDVRPSRRAQQVHPRLGRAAAGGWVALHGTNCRARPDRRRVGRRRATSRCGSTRSARSSSPTRRSPRTSSRTSHPTTGSSPASSRSRPTDELYLNEYPDRNALVPLLQTTYQRRRTGLRRGRLDDTDRDHLVMYLRPLGRGCRAVQHARPLPRALRHGAAEGLLPNVDRCSWELPVFHELLRRSIALGARRRRPPDDQPSTRSRWT